MMLETANDGFINTDQVREIRASWDKAKHQFEVACTFNSGPVETYNVNSREWEQFKKVAQHSAIIKADPGYWLLTYRAEADEVGRWPVLAWRLDLQHGFHHTIIPWSGGILDDDEHGGREIGVKGGKAGPGRGKKTGDNITRFKRGTSRKGACRG
jgi:hypothetical protein